jgi:hypothetical protein
MEIRPKCPKCTLVSKIWMKGKTPTGAQKYQCYVCKFLWICGPKHRDKGKKLKVTYTIDENGCHICTSHRRNKQGYPRGHRNGKNESIFRILYEEKYGKIPDGLVARHTCDNRLCINSEHCDPGTPQQNSQDAVDRNRFPIGEDRPMAKLKNIEVLFIKKDTTIPSKELAVRFDVSYGAINSIRKGKTWKHIV